MGALTAGNKDKRKYVLVHLFNKVSVEISVVEGP